MGKHWVAGAKQGCRDAGASLFWLLGSKELLKISVDQLAPRQ